MVKLENVVKLYGTEKHPIPAVDNVSLLVEPGEFLIVTGPSGSGKTTLLNLIGGMTHPDQGTVLINGKDIFQMKDAELSDFRASKIGFVFQFQSMITTLNVIDNILLPSVFSGQNVDVRKVKSCLERVGLENRWHAFSHELSLGQQRRVGIVRSIIYEPRLLLCDEPTGDLDPETEMVIMEMLQEANQSGTTVIMTTHNHYLKSYATKLFSVNNGNLIKN